MAMDLTRYRHTLHAHDFTPGGTSRVVMIRKKEQRTFAHAINGQEPKLETLTRETVQTFRGNKIERKITSQKRDCQQVQQDLIKKLTQIAIEHEEKPKKTNNVPTIVEGGIQNEKAVKKKADHLVPSVADRFALDCLAAHNEKRALHKSPPLKLSKKLCKFSEEWARHLASRGETQSRPESSYGENLFQIWHSNPNAVITGREPVEYWYNEIKDHVFGREPPTLKTGHFTQVVWLDSKHLGVGVAKGRTGQFFVVCNYDPPGNFIGSFASNVPPLGGFVSIKKMSVTAPTNDLEFQKEMLQIHNEYRMKHGVPSLKLNPDLSAYSQEWALRLASVDKLEHRTNHTYGENLFVMWGKDPTPRDAVSGWYSESKGYVYGKEPHDLNAGHFTQLVWKDSKELGVGQAKSKTGKVYIVCNYNPPGNIISQFSINVPRPK